MDTKEKVSLNLTEFASNTTLHGLNKACEANSHILRRTIWIILLICAIGAYLFITTTSILKYYSFDTNTKITQTTVKELEFPSVSICQQNQFAKSLVENDPHLHFWVEYLELHPHTTLTNEEKQNASQILDTIPLWNAFAPLPANFLSRCEFEGRPFECDDYFTVEMSEISVCATLMSWDIREGLGPWKTDTPGYSFGLSKSS